MEEKRLRYVIREREIIGEYNYYKRNYYNTGACIHSKQIEVIIIEYFIITKNKKKVGEKRVQVEENIIEKNNNLTKKRGDKA